MERPFSRAAFLALGTGSLAAGVLAQRPAHLGDPDWVKRENELPGSTDWNVPASQHASGPELAAYPTAWSMVPGQPLVLRVDHEGRVRAHAYRVGWYGGKGGRLVASSGWVTPPSQPPAAVTTFDERGRLVNLVDTSAWRDTLAMDTHDWPEGTYIMVVESGSGHSVQVPLTLRSRHPQGRTVIVNSTTTWQAYNRWGGASCYYGTTSEGGWSPAARSRVVSFERPLDRAYGVQHFLTMERGLVVEAERLGLDLAYTTSADMAAGSAFGATAVVTLGHDEYWSNDHHRHLVALRDSGTNLLFAGANSMWWRIRYTHGVRRFDIFKDRSADPETVNFPGGHVRSLVGSVYTRHAMDSPLVISHPEAWLFEGTGARKGQKFDGLLRVEVDSVIKAGWNPRRLEVLNHTDFVQQVAGKQQPGTADMTYYSALSGAGVVNFGTMGVAAALEGLDKPAYPVPEASRKLAARLFENALREVSRPGLGRRIPSRPNLSDIPG